MKSLLLSVSMFITLTFYGQTGFSELGSYEYRADVALYLAKYYLIENVLETSESYKKLYIDPLAASKSTEISSIYYEGEVKRGLLLGFFDDFASSGNSFKGYGYLNLEFDDALELLNEIERIIETERKYLNVNDNEHNVYFKKDDLTVVIYREGTFSGRIRIFWKQFDGQWENTAFRRTKRRFEKAVENSN